jgi:hypothetical protein
VPSIHVSNFLVFICFVAMYSLLHAAGCKMRTLKGKAELMGREPRSHIPSQMKHNY